MNRKCTRNTKLGKKSLTSCTIVISTQLLLTLEVAVLAVAVKVVFGLVLLNGLANQNQFRSATLNQSYHCFALSSL